MTRTEKNASISAMILKFKAEFEAATGNAEGNTSLKFAIDRVLGVGTFEAMVAEVYEAARAAA